MNRFIIAALLIVATTIITPAVAGKGYYMTVDGKTYYCVNIRNTVICN